MSRAWRDWICIWKVPSGSDMGEERREGDGVEILEQVYSKSNAIDSILQLNAGHHTIAFTPDSNLIEVDIITTEAMGLDRKVEM